MPSITMIITFLKIIFEWGDWELGMGDWGLGIGDWGLGIGPNPQSPIPNPQSPIPKTYHSFLFRVNNINILLHKSRSYDSINRENKFNCNYFIRFLYS